MENNYKQHSERTRLNKKYSLREILNKGKKVLTSVRMLPFSGQWRRKTRFLWHGSSNIQRTIQIWREEQRKLRVSSTDVAGTGIESIAVKLFVTSSTVTEVVESEIDFSRNTVTRTVGGILCRHQFQLVSLELISKGPVSQDGDQVTMHSATA